MRITGVFGVDKEQKGYCGALDLAAVERYIELNCADVTLERVGDHFNCHPNSITRILKRGRGASFRSVLAQMRAARARELLCSGATVEETARACGYSNLSHFSAMFRRQCGSTPGTYRRRELCASEPSAHASGALVTLPEEVSRAS